MALVQHHVTYQELQGVDKTVIMEKGEHSKLHRRLRREGKCKIPAKELNRISTAAHHRSRKRKTFGASYGLNTILRETIIYNELTNEIHYSSGFHGTHGHHLKHIMSC